MTWLDYRFRVTGVLVLRDPDDFDAEKVTSTEAVEHVPWQSDQFTVEKVDLLVEPAPPPSAQEN